MLTRTIFLIFLNIGLASCGANDGDAEVTSILDEIRDLLFDHYKVKPQRLRNRQQPDPEDQAAADLLDDVRYTPEQAKAVLNGMKRRWGYPIRDRIYPNKTDNYWKFPLKYTFEPEDHSEAERAVVRTAMEIWSNNSCVTFEEYPNSAAIGEQPHLRIFRGSGCWSYIGVIRPDGQNLSLATGCIQPGTIAHEIGHALGLWHEFSRPDRDDYVKIIWENILAGKEHNFALNPIEDDVDPANTSYDVSSLMHYDSLGFSINSTLKKRVMMPVDIHHLTAIGQRARLQFSDIKRVNYAYKCIERSCKPEQLERPCLNGGYQDPKNCKKCRCPPGTAGDNCGGVPTGQGQGMTGCGGYLWMEPCTIRTISLPMYPQAYGNESHCSWRIKTSANGLAFSFQEKPDLPCSSADTCYDYVEIKTNMNAIDSPGKFFCACGENRGRVAQVDNGEALVRFSSTTTAERGGAGKRNGFLLNVYATCETTRSVKEIPNSCTISSTGYESCTGVAMPICYADQAEFIEPVMTTTTSTTTPQPTTSPQKEKDGASAAVASSFLLAAALVLAIA